MRDGYQIKKE